MFAGVQSPAAARQRAIPQYHMPRETCARPVLTPARRLRHLPPSRLPLPRKNMGSNRTYPFLPPDHRRREHHRVRILMVALPRRWDRRCVDGYALPWNVGAAGWVLGGFHPVDPGTSSAVVWKVEDPGQGGFASIVELSTSSPPHPHGSSYPRCSPFFSPCHPRSLVVPGGIE